MIWIIQKYACVYVYSINYIYIYVIVLYYIFMCISIIHVFVCTNTNKYVNIFVCLCDFRETDFVADDLNSHCWARQQNSMFSAQLYVTKTDKNF